MNLLERLEAAARRFRTDNPNSPASTFIFGFVAPDGQSASVAFDRLTARVTPGVREAQYLVYGSDADLSALLDADAPNRSGLAARLTMRPDYPFNQYLLSIFLNTFFLMVPDLDYRARRFDGPFPFPPRWPAAENSFRQRTAHMEPLPAFEPECLPELIADEHPIWPEMALRAWKIGFRNLRQPEPDSGFIANFIDPAFNDNVFLWDSCFMTMFGRYARRHFRFMGTLDNFYAKQHDDGFICREINSYSGRDLFQSLDPRSTGPNIVAWTELEDYRFSGDMDRLREIFPGLVAYHRWWRDWRTHPDGGYWTSGWGSGMDNQTRVPDSEFHHRHYTWLDATLQQALCARCLLQMGRLIGRDEFDAELTADHAFLTDYINTKLWDERTGFYFDRAPDGSLSTTKSVGAYWALLADVVPPDRLARFVAHLDDPASFKRPHRVPTQSADSPVYHPYGGYWQGAVWPPTNLMVLAGLAANGFAELAHAIAVNHVDQVATVFAETGTLWENYAPEHAEHGRPASRDFVGWTGVSAITIPIEYGIGLRPGDSGTDLLWDIRLNGRHGVRRYPLPGSGDVDVLCEGSAEERALSIRASRPITLDVHYAGATRRFALDAGTHRIALEKVKEQA